MAINDVLLDTHAFLWAVSDDRRLSARAKAVFTDSSRRLLLSVASVWEMAIKSSLGRLTLSKPLGTFLDEQLPANDIAILNLTRTHAAGVEDLPFHHRDPFDRLIIVQAIHEGAEILSADATLDAYEGLSRIW